MTSAPPTVRIAGTVVSRTGERTIRQDHPKTARSRRVVAIPSFTAEAIRRHLTQMPGAGLDDLLFGTRNGTPMTTNNIRRQLRQVMSLAGIDGVTPHAFRRTVATAIHQQAGVDLAAELLGHTDTKITMQHYVRRSEMVNPDDGPAPGRRLRTDQGRPRTTRRRSPLHYAAMRTSAGRAAAPDGTNLTRTPARTCGLRRPRRGGCWFP